MDGQFGSVGKGAVTSYIAQKYKGQFTFAFNNFSSQAAHWVKLQDGRKFLYKTLNSMAYDLEAYQKLFISPGSAIEVESLLQEIKENGITPEKLGIHPLTTIVSKLDAEYERGECGFDGERFEHQGTIKHGSTCSGVGAAVARKTLRRPSVMLAKHIPELRPYLSIIDEEIMQRLDNGESGIGEIPQGWGLSNSHPLFYPFTTYRNVSVSQLMADAQLPLKYCGPVIISFRTYPIRISSKKYIGKYGLNKGRHLTWEEIQSGIAYDTVDSDSGGCYPDQEEITWGDLSAVCGREIQEFTSKTKLPRRVFTFSKMNLEDAIRHNDCGHGIYLALTFGDYVDPTIAGAKSMTSKSSRLYQWIERHLGDYKSNLILVKTGPLTEDVIDLCDPHSAI